MLTRINFNDILWYKYFSYFGIFTSIIWFAFDRKMQIKLKQSLSSPFIIILILFNISFSYYIYSLTPATVYGTQDDVTTASNLIELSNLRHATQRAMTAFIIAYLAYLDHYIAAFWVVWVFNYELNSRVTN